MFRDSLSNQAHYAFVSLRKHPFLFALRRWGETDVFAGYAFVRCSNLASDGGLGVFPCSGEGDLCSNGELTYIGDVEAARKQKDKANQPLACGQKRISGRRFSPCTRKVA